MKQTAVDWLIEQLNIWQTISDEDTNSTLNTVRKLLEQAKEMEKAATISKKEIVELSDEEIEKFAKSINPYPSTKQGSVDWENGFIRAIQWYREQLRQHK
jgi:sialic acid synthase SpsE